MPKQTVFHALPSTVLSDGVSLARPIAGISQQVNLTDPAVSVMTDLSLVGAVTVSDTATLAEAQERMKHFGVRMLLVEGKDSRVCGLLTLTDLSGEKPIRAAKEAHLSHDEVLVREIMTQGDHLEAIWLSDVLAAKVGHIVSTLRQYGRQHALVVEPATVGNIPVIRGLFSTSQLSKQLGMPLNMVELPRSFSEVHAELTHV